MFDAFIDRLEKPLAEPVIVTVADKVMDAQVACVRCAGAIIENALCAALYMKAKQ